MEIIKRAKSAKIAGYFKKSGSAEFMVVMVIAVWMFTGCSGSRDISRNEESIESLYRIERGWHLSVIHDSITDHGIILIDSAEIKTVHDSMTGTTGDVGQSTIKLKGIRIDRSRNQQVTTVSGDSVTIQTVQSAIKEQKQHEVKKTSNHGATFSIMIIAILTVSGITALTLSNKRKNN